MRRDQPLRPDYATSFRCIGGACEDSCCEDWTVGVDGAAYARYEALPAGPLRSTIVESILPAVANSAGVAGSVNPPPFAIQMVRRGGVRVCPLLASDGLCRIHAELGASYLSHTCATYPRIRYSIAGNEECALSLSCPEAARLVLLSPALAQAAGPGAEAKPESTLSGDGGLTPFFHSIRNFALELIRNRSYPLWQRMFLLGLFAARFDALGKDRLEETVAELLALFEGAIGSGSVRVSLETLKPDGERQLDLVLRRGGVLLHRSHVRPRFVECVEAFGRGIGNGPGATLHSLAGRYAEAHRYAFAPFFERHPHMLENYLSNTIFRSRFPFGRDWARDGAAASMTREFELLTTQFALVKGLLIGVAGGHGEAFCEAHVVQTVQAVSKHFDHHADFLKDAYALLVESGMAGPMGMAILLQDANPAGIRAGLAPFLEQNAPDVAHEKR